MKLGFEAHVLDGRDQGIKTLMIRIIDEMSRRHPEHDLYVYSEHPHAELDFSLPNLHFRPTVHRGVARHLLLTMPRAKRTDGLDTMIFNFISSPVMRDATVMIHDILAQTHPRYFSRLFTLRCWIFYGISSFLSRYILTISEYSRAEIYRVYPWTRRKKVHIMHIGASFPEAIYFNDHAPAQAPTHLRANGRYALCVGRIEPRKNVQMAIDAFLKGAPVDTKLVIVGRCEPGFHLETYQDERIIYLGGVDDAELIELYRYAELFIYPTSAEGFGLPLLDAILFGVPTISSNLTSMAEVGGDCVAFFNPEEPGATDCLSEMISCHFNGMSIPAPNLTQRRERIAKYSWENASRNLLQALERHSRGKSLVNK